MPTTYSDLLSKAEQAGVALINTLATPPANVLTGQSSLDKVAPCVIVEAPNTDPEEDPPETGNFWIDLDVVVKTMAPVDVDGVSPKAVNDLLVQQIFDLFSASDTAAGLNNSALNFGCQAVRLAGHSFHVDSDAWVNTLRLRVYCAAAWFPP